MARSYHHGELRKALIAAAIEELREHGRDRFSLRRTASRAGVSHAAPAHHFGNAEGLLAAVRSEGFARLVAAMSARRDAESETAERFVATGVGYVDFALAEPALFDLMFGTGGASSPELAGKGGPENEAFHLLLNALAPMRSGPVDREFWLAVAAAWSLVHGYAQLVAAGRMAFLDEVGPDREATLRLILRRALAFASAA